MADYLDGYKEVPERIADFKALYPTGSLQPADPSRPFWVEWIGDKAFVCYAAAAYRTPDDPRPGIGTAWEPTPGTTNFTKNSEVQNAETSAWGRAIVAVLASESKTIASASDVRNRRAEQDPMEDTPPGSESKPIRSSKSVSSGGGTPDTRLATEKQRGLIRGKLKDKGYGLHTYPEAWAAADLPAIDSQFPFAKVNDALAFIEALEPAS